MDLNYYLVFSVVVCQLQRLYSFYSFDMNFAAQVPTCTIVDGFKYCSTVSGKLVVLIVA